MSYQEGSNWQAKKEDEKKPLYDEDPEFEKKVHKELMGHCGLPVPKERTFTLQEALEIWRESGKYHSVDGFWKNSPDMPTYFKQRFGITI